MVLKSDALLEQWRAYLRTDAGRELTRRNSHVYQLNISEMKAGVCPRAYTVDLLKREITKGPYDGVPDATFSMLDEVFVKIATGKMSPQVASMRGVMKVQGSLSAAQKFTPDVFPRPAKM